MKNKTTILILFLSLTLIGCNLIKKEDPNGTESEINYEKNSSIDPPTAETIEKFYDAIHSKKTALALKMLDTEFPPDFEPTTKILPLQAAIWENNLAIVKKLIENNARIDTDDFSGVKEAASYGTFEILKYLVSKKGNINNGAFNHAKNYKCAKFLLENGADANQGEVSGTLSFYLEAVTRDDRAALKLLNLNKNNLDYNNCEGDTALIIAIKARNIEMVKYLIALGVDVEKPETFDCGDDISVGKKPLELAIESKNIPLIQLIKNSTLTK